MSERDMNRNLANIPIDEVAIETIRMYAPREGYWLADSGGKDSCVVRDLVMRSGVKFDAHYGVSPVDPPEVRRFLREYHPDTAWERSRYSALALAKSHGMLPTRKVRWCCAEWKERGGAGRTVLTGIRAGESTRRARRKTLEVCYRTPGKRYLHPILWWTTAEVWAYIHNRGLPYCNLYDEGQQRIGCVLCPMTGCVEEQVARWPRIAALWRRMAYVAWETGNNRGGLAHPWSSADDYFAWWLDRDAPAPQGMPLLDDLDDTDTPMRASCEDKEGG